MVIEDPIELRGHHLSLFADYYFRRHNNNNKPREEIVDKYSDYITRTYSAEMRSKMNNLWQKLIDNPEERVQVIEGLDSLCNGCSNYDPKKCGPHKAEEDKFTIDEYEISSGAHYVSRDLIARFEAYRKVSGFKHPRERLLALMPLFEIEDDEISDEEIDRIMNGGEK